jgi:hypothetical protein
MATLFLQRYKFHLQGSANGCKDFQAFSANFQYLLAILWKIPMFVVVLQQQFSGRSDDTA